MNIASQFYGPMGIPQHARELTKALLKLDPDTVPIQIIPDVTKDRLGMTSELEFKLKQKLNGSLPGLIFWYPDAYPSLNIFKKTLGYYIFEYTKIPPKYVEIINESLDGICTASAWGKKVLEDNGVTIPVYIIPGGADPDLFVDEEFEKFGVDYGYEFKFLHVGKCEGRKGTELLIRAFNKFSKGDEEIRLTLLIDNPHIPNFKAEDYVKELGKTLLWPIKNIDIVHSIENMKKLYMTHDCAVFPTCAEGIGLPIVEAMACGLPTIVSYNTGITEYANDDRAILLKRLVTEPVYDKHFFPNAGQFGTWQRPTENELIEKMDYAMHNHGVDDGWSKAQNARKYLKENYTWEIAAKKLLEVCK